VHVFHFSFFLSCHNSYIHIFMVTGYLHMTMRSYAVYKTRLSKKICITIQRSYCRVSRRDYDVLVYVPKCAHYQYILRNNLLNCHTVYRRCASDERKAHEYLLTRSLQNHLRWNRQYHILVRYDNSHFRNRYECPSTRISIFCLFVFKKKRACTKLAVEKILLAYSLRPKNFRNPNGSSTESLSVI